MILSCHNICKAFGTDEILRSVSFHIEEHEKAAVVGINGAGKSTLLRIIVGEEAADEGEVTIAKGATIGYLAQQNMLSGSRSIYDEVAEVMQDVIDLENPKAMLSKTSWVTPRRLIAHSNSPEVSIENLASGK